MADPFEIGQRTAQQIRERRQAGAEQQRQQQDQSTVADIFTRLREGKGNDRYDDAIGEILNKVSPERQAAALKLVQDYRNNQQQKAALTANEELNQIRQNTQRAIDNLLAPFKTGPFGALQLANKDKRQEVEEEIRRIAEEGLRRQQFVAKRHGLQIFEEGAPQAEGAINQDQLIQEALQKKPISKEEAQQFWDAAGQEGLRGDERRRRAAELAIQAGFDIG